MNPRGCHHQCSILTAVLCALLALSTYTILPTLIENAILKDIILRPDSSSFEPWRKSHNQLFQRFYFFNLTNIDRVFSHNEKPRLSQLGPYTFSYSYEKVNISWDRDQDKVDYAQLKSWTFVPALTNGSLSDEVFHLNVPLLSAINQIQSVVPLANQETSFESLNAIIENYKLKLYLRNSIQSLLFDGYEDKLLLTASEFYPSRKIQTRFAWFYDRNNTSDGLFRIYTGANNDMGKKLGLLVAWNNATYNTKWKRGSECQSFNSTSAGELQPPFFLSNNNRLLSFSITSQDENINNRIIRHFSAEMCRTIELEFLKSDSVKNVPTYRYGPTDRMMNYSIMDNRCYCLDDLCPPNGLYHVGACNDNAPIYISYPHFLYANPLLRQQVDGLNPVPSQHEFFIDYDKKLGLALNVQANIQINVFVKQFEQIEIMENWPSHLEGVYMPQFWSSVGTTVDDRTATILSFILNYLPWIILATTSMFAFICVSILVYLGSLHTKQILWPSNTMVRYASVQIGESENNRNNIDISMKDLL